MYLSACIPEDIDLACFCRWKKPAKCCNASEEIDKINQQLFLSLHQMQGVPSWGTMCSSGHSTQKVHKRSGGGASKQNAPGGVVKQDPEWATPRRRWDWQVILKLVNFSHNNGAKLYWLLSFSTDKNWGISSNSRALTLEQVLNPLANENPLSLPQNIWFLLWFF